MATKIRLARHGKKRYAYYHIVVADARAKRDGKNIERIGDYNPNTDPATINLDFDRALYWVQEGAQPTDTARAILSYKGVMYKNHLLNGVKKGALTEDQVESKFNEWIADKESRVQAKRDDLKKKADAANAERIAAESKIKEERAKEILAKQSPLAEGEAAVAGAAAVVAAGAVADAVADVVDGDETPAEAVAEATEQVEAAVEAAAEEAGVEVDAEAVAEEAVSEAAEDLAKDAEAIQEEVKEEAPAAAEAAEQVSDAADAVAEAAEEATEEAPAAEEAKAEEEE